MFEFGFGREKVFGQVSKSHGVGVLALVFNWIALARHHPRYKQPRSFRSKPRHGAMEGAKYASSSRLYTELIWPPQLAPAVCLLDHRAESSPFPTV